MVNTAVAWIASTKIWRWLARSVVAHLSLRLWGEPAASLDPGLLRAWQAVQAWQREQQGVICFACRGSGLGSRLVRWATGGRYSHAGILLLGEGPFDSWQAVHMLSDGLRVEHPMATLAQADEVAIIGYGLSPSQLWVARERVRDILISKQWLEYDFQALIGPDTGIYCSELVYRVISGLSDARLSVVAGRLAFIPDDVVRYGQMIYQWGKPK